MQTFKKILKYILPESIRGRQGRRWSPISGRLMQIDSGPFGCVWGVNKLHYIYCRTGIAWNNLKGSKWKRVTGSLKYVSCGERGVFGVNRANNIYFRRGVTRTTPQG